MKIVVTGGPGGGKTTALDLFRRELLGEVEIVPESATAIFSSGVCRDDRDEVVKAIQKMIYYFQVNMESLYQKQRPNKVYLCDRGTLDGLAYWPESEERFFETTKSDLETELKRYDAVIFFETAAKTGNDISTNNSYRNETTVEAIKLDDKLQTIWRQHPNFYLVKSQGSFMGKINAGIEVIKEVLGKDHE